MVRLLFFMLLLPCLCVHARKARKAKKADPLEVPDGGYILHQSIADNNRFNYTVAAYILEQLIDPSPLFQPIGGRPLLHHLMNMYWRASDKEQKLQLADLMSISIQKGAPVDVDFKGEPDILHKALITRQIGISVAIAQNSKNVSIDAKKLGELYAISCNTTPLVKLLLHADTLVQKTPPAEPGVKGIKKLLEGAYLEGQNPVVQAKEIGVFSKTHDAVLGRMIPSMPGHEIDILLQEIMDILAEVAGEVHAVLLKHKNAKPVALATALSTVLAHGRNPLHTLAMSGSAVMVSALAGAFEKATVNEEAKLLMRTALTSADIRGKSPIAYAALRYGESPVLTAIRRLGAAVGLDLAEVIDSLAFANMHPREVAKTAEEEESAVDAAEAVATMGPEPVYEEHTGSGEVSAGERRRIRAAHGDTGGWDTSRLGNHVMGDVNRCDITERWGPMPSAEDFFRDFISTGTPVIFRGAALGGKMRAAFRKEKFIQEYGSFKVPISEIPYPGTFGLSATTTTFKEIANYVGENASATKVEVEVGADGSADPAQAQGRGASPQKPPQYVFTVSSQQWQKKVQADAPVPGCLNIQVEGREVLQRDGAVVLQLYLGPLGSGAPVHFHGHAANTLAYGEKKWYLFPPAKSFYSKTPALEFLRSDPRAASALVCTQRGGDVMYVPPLWGHATVNTQQSIGVAHEFSVEAFCME